MMKQKYFLIIGVFIVGIVLISGCTDTDLCAGKSCGDTCDPDTNLAVIYQCQPDGSCDMTIPKCFEEISDILCSAEKPCPEGLECFSFPRTLIRCAQPDPCSYYECPEDTYCSVAESYPMRVFCSPATPSCEDYHYSNCPEECLTKCVPSVCSGGVCTSDCDGEGSCYSSEE